MNEPARGGTAPPRPNGQAAGHAQSHAPTDRLAPEESRRRKFDILDGIDAIPVKLMPSNLKPLTRAMMSYARYGRRLCWASSTTLAKRTGVSSRTIRNQILKLLEMEWVLPAGRRSTTGRSRPQFAVGPKLIKYLRLWLAYVDKLRAERRGETCGTTCSTRVGTTCSTSSEPRVPIQPYSSSGPTNRDDEPGRDVRTSDMGIAPSVPVEETNSDGGTIPFDSPSTSTHAEGPLPTLREMVIQLKIESAVQAGKSWEEVEMIFGAIPGIDPAKIRVMIDRAKGVSA